MKFRLLHSSILVFATLFVLTQSAKAQYCMPPGTTLISDEPLNSITKVMIQGTTLNHTTASVAASGYVLVQDTTATATLQAGNAYSFSISYVEDDADGIGIWIDYDRNQQFSAAEFTAVSVNNSNNTVVSITIPATAVSGSTRMRISASDDFVPSAGDACADHVEGEVEDYTITISGGGAIPCNAPAMLAKSNITGSGATVTWPSQPGTGYEYALAATGNSPVAGTAVPDTFILLTGLVPATKYFIHVRTVCSAGLYSSWITDSFTTINASAGVSALEPERIRLRVYPNPATSDCTVETPASPGTIEVFSTDGQRLLRVPVTGKSTVVGLHLLPRGMYLLRYTGNGRTAYQQVVRQ